MNHWEPKDWRFQLRTLVNKYTIFEEYASFIELLLSESRMHYTHKPRKTIDKTRSRKTVGTGNRPTKKGNR